MYRGRADVVPVDTAGALAAFLDGLGPSEALSNGIPKGGAETIPIGMAREGGTARTLDHFEYPAGPGWFLLDYDDKGQPPEIQERIKALGGPWRALVSLWPALAGAERVFRASSSDGVSAPGCGTIKSAGSHFYVLFKDMSKARETLDALSVRAWAHGLGFFIVSKGGAFLSRSIVDATVASPERLIIEAAPILHPPVVRAQRPTLARSGVALDPLPPPSPETQAEAEAAQEQARRALLPEAEKAAAEYETAQAEKVARKHKITVPEARIIVRARIAGKVLSDDDVLDGPNGEAWRVGDILDRGARPDGPHSISLPDPIEGIAYGADKATLFFRPRPDKPNERPRLVSHAHGVRTVYRFARYESPEGPPPPMPYPERGDDNRERGADRHREVIRNAVGEFGRLARARREMEAAQREIATANPFPDPIEAGGDVGREQARKANKAARRPIIKARLIAREEARARIAARHGVTPQAMTRKGARLMLTGAQGIGKTHAALRSVMGARGQVGWMLTPTRAKAIEAAGDYERERGVAMLAGETPPPVGFIWEGRSAEGMCAFPDEAGEAARRGVNVAKAMCANCPLFEGCAYQANIKRAKVLAEGPDGLILFASHDVATVRLPSHLTPDWIIWDEAPRNFLADDHPRSIPVAELGGDRTPARPSGNPGRVFASEIQEAADMADALADLLRQARPAEIAVRDALLKGDGRALDILREKGWARETLSEAANTLRKFEDKSLERAMQAAMAESGFVLGEKARGLAKKRLRQALDGAAEKWTRAAREVLEAVAIEMDAPRPGLSAVRLNKAGTHVEAWRRTPLTIPLRAPMLILDGTGEEAVARAAFASPHLQQVHIPVERHAYTLQIVGKSFSNQSILGVNAKGAPAWPEEAARTRKHLTQAINAFGEAWVGGTKPVMEALGDALPHAKRGHFGALRGLNVAEHCEVAFSIGRNLPPPEALENKAAALHAADPEPIKRLNPEDGWPKEARALRMRDGSVQTVEVEVHPDPRVDVLLRQARDAEVAQNLDRSRPMFCASPRLLVIFGAVAADVTVDEVVTWAEFKSRMRAARALAAGALPLSISGAVNMHPGIWSKGSAGNDQDLRNIISAISDKIAPSGSPPQTPNSIPIWRTGGAKCLTVCRYRRVPRGAKGGDKVDLAAAVAGTADNARAILEKLTGPLERFEVVREIRLAPEAPRQPAPRPGPMPDDWAEEAASFWEADGLPRDQAERRAWAQWEQERARPTPPPWPAPQQADEHRPKRAAGP